MVRPPSWEVHFALTVITCSLLLAPSNSYGDDRSLMSLASLCSNPLALRCDQASPLPSHFTVKWYLAPSLEVAESDLPTLITICELDGEECRMLATSGNGIPYAYFCDKGVYFVTSSSEVIHFPGVKFQLHCNTTSFPQLLISSDLERSACSLNTFRVAHELIAEDHDCRLSTANSRYQLTRDNGSVSTIDIARRVERGASPIIGFSIRTSKGIGYRVENILHSHPPQLHHCGKLLESGALGQPVRRTTTGGELRELFPLDDENKLAVALSGSKHSAARLEWRDHILRTPAQTRDELSQVVQRLNHLLANEAEPADVLLNDLCDRLLTEIYEKSISSDTGNKPPIACGWEPSVARTIFERAYGGELRKNAQDTLALAVKSKAINRASRLRAADFLGVVGLQSRGVLLRDLQAISRSDRELSAILASVAIRSRCATETDLHTVKRCASDVNSPRSVRLACLEAVFLSEHDAEFDSSVSDLLATAEFDDFYAGRCVLAGMRSSSGRKVILEGCRRGWASCPPEIVFPLTRWTLRKTDFEWEALLSTCEFIAKDESRSMAERVIAAKYASLGEPSRPERVAFVEAALARPEDPLFRIAVTQFLVPDRNADVYLQSLIEGMPQLDIESKRFALQALTQALPKRLTPVSEAKLRVLLEQCSAELDPAIQSSARKLEERVEQR